ncbi:MAG: cytochrome C [Candidatus Aminicenantes bacterium]|nr:cytochrome C [Candidatus Aminicenantes bacterium]
MQIKQKSRIVLCLIMCTSGAFGQISGSAHDFSSQSWSNEICLPCHTPHNANSTVQGAPLWNHEVTSATFTPYTSPTMDVEAGQPQGVSKLCLSCHDGTVAVDSFGGNSGSTFINGEFNLATDLSDDHPISIDWEHQTAPPAGSCGKCHFVHGGQITKPFLPFFDGKIECASCHDAHNTYNLTKLLRLPLEGSELCFYCHGK